MPPSFSLHQASDQDLELTYEITEDAMRDYVEQTWGRWDIAEQRAKHLRNFEPATHRIVRVGAAPAGFIAVEDEPTHLWLVKLYLLRRFRGGGLGAALLRLVIDEATAAGKPVRLRVLRVNVRAQRFYTRHGFHVVGEEPERLFMERGPGLTPPPDRER